MASITLVQFLQLPANRQAAVIRAMPRDQVVALARDWKKAVEEHRATGKVPAGWNAPGVGFFMIPFAAAAATGGAAMATAGGAGLLATISAAIPGILTTIGSIASTAVGVMQAVNLVKSMSSGGGGGGGSTTPPPPPPPPPSSNTNQAATAAKSGGAGLAIAALLGLVLLTGGRRA